MVFFYNNAFGDVLKFGVGNHYIMYEDYKGNDPDAYLSSIEKFNKYSGFSSQVGFEKYFNKHSLELLLDFEFYSFCYRHRVFTLDDISGDIIEESIYTNTIFSIYMPVNILFSFNIIKNRKYKFFIKSGPAFKFLLYYYYNSASGKPAAENKSVLFPSSKNNTLMKTPLFSIILKPGLDIYLNNGYFLYFDIPLLATQSLFDIKKWNGQIGINAGFGFEI